MHSQNFLLWDWTFQENTNTLREYPSLLFFRFYTYTEIQKMWLCHISILRKCSPTSNMWVNLANLSRNSCRIWVWHSKISTLVLLLTRYFPPLQFSAPYSPYFPHIHGYRSLSASNPDQCLILCYEDMKKDPEKEIRKVAAFLGIPISEDKVAEVARKTSFEAMSQNPSTNYKVSAL